MEPQENALQPEDRYKKLKADANRMADWRTRVKAIEELGALDHPHAVDVLMHRMQQDPVYRVQVAAYEQLKGLGEEVHKPKPSPEEPVKGVTKMLVRIKKSLPKDHTYEQFKDKLNKMRADVYDIYEGEKGDGFDAWLEAKWSDLRI
ncbi:HEAT repeat domain-containing protein [Paenibacillus sp. F411]|nr:HEAT repeat domain-containing protein [Paenibacillus sp. F411]